MRLVHRELLKHSTPTRELQVEKLRTHQILSELRTNDQKFSRLCEEGCVNFNKKYSCPPLSPSFKNYSKGKREIAVILYRIFLHQYDDISPYNRLRASNSVLKSLLDKELLSYRQQGLVIVGSGSCRACKPCGAKVGVKCKKPEKIIYSLESLGVDVHHLVQVAFGFELQWYKKNNSQDFTSVVGGVLR